jgi:hypothetical protein
MEDHYSLGLRDTEVNRYSSLPDATPHTLYANSMPPHDKPATETSVHDFVEPRHGGSSGMFATVNFADESVAFFLLSYLFVVKNI